MKSDPAARTNLISRALKREDIRHLDTAPDGPTVIVPGPGTGPEKVVAILDSFGWPAEIVGAKTIEVPDGQHFAA